MSNRRTQPEVDIQLADAKATTDTTIATMSGPLVSPGPQPQYYAGLKVELIHLIVRLLCLFTSVTSLLLMITAKQSATISIYGFNLPVFSKWSFSDSFEYLVGVSTAIAVHTVLQLLISSSRLLRKSPIIPSRNHAWLMFAGDQIFAYAVMSAGSAASGVTNLNRTGIRHSALPNFCKPLPHFCDHVAVSIAFAFISCFLLATSAVLDVVWLSKY